MLGAHARGSGVSLLTPGSRLAGVGPTWELVRSFETDSAEEFVRALEEWLL